MDITTISTETLEKDLQESVVDIKTCEVALLQGIQTYSEGSVEERLRLNKHFVEVISKELKRRVNGNME